MWPGRSLDMVEPNPYSWSVTIVSLSGLESDERNHRSEWKPNSWGMFLNTGVSMRQVRASHTSVRYNVYMRPSGITRNFLVVLRRFWHSIFVRKICRRLWDYSEFDQYSLRLGIFFQFSGMKWDVLRFHVFFFFGILNFGIGIPIWWLFNSRILKKKMTRISSIGNGIGILLPMGVPEIGTKNWNSQPTSGAPWQPWEGGGHHGWHVCVFYLALASISLGTSVSGVRRPNI
jgi:hypothetical protein